ncbi:MAG: hypothetical protein EOM23_10870, partial [Candidatus Moranbacteria bacterium]|nr:hypothetical protein [Candidatus Moranbacteria bacterium]
MKNQNNLVVIDQRTGELIADMKPTHVHKMPEIPSAFRKGKAGQQLTILYSAIWFRNHPALATLY